MGPVLDGEILKENPAMEKIYRSVEDARKDVPAVSDNDLLAARNVQGLLAHNGPKRASKSELALVIAPATEPLRQNLAEAKWHWLDRANACCAAQRSLDFLAANGMPLSDWPEEEKAALRAALQALGSAYADHI